MENLVSCWQTSQ